MQIAIAVAVMGAIALIVFASVTPTLFGSFGQTYQQTQAACVLQGERFTAVNTMQDWTGDDRTVTADGTSCGGLLQQVSDGSPTAEANTYYTPQGVAITVPADNGGATTTAVTTVSANVPGAKWEPALAIMTEQGGINRLVITILPLLTILGAIYLLYNWHKGRQTA